jgi:CRP/FNR family transcriptional regulator
MAEPNILDVLHELPHFRALPRDLLEEIAHGCRVRTHAAGEILFRQGDPCRGFFVVRKGAVRVYRQSKDGHEQVLHHVRAGQSFAEAALLGSGRYPADAAATEAATEVVEIGGEVFMRLFRTDSRLAAAMVSSLCVWMHELVERIDELSVASAGARLARYVLRLPAAGSGDPLTIELPMAKKELAAHLAITPETLSRLLRRWQDRGVVRPSGKSLVILDSRVLLAIADREDDAAG